MVVVVIVVVVVAAAAVAVYHRVMREYTDKPSQSVFIYFRMKSLKKALKSDTFGKLTHDLQTLLYEFGFDLSKVKISRNCVAPPLWL